MKKVLFLMMGGSGTRLGAAIPKQFLEVNGRPIYQFVLDLYAKYSVVDRVVIINNSKWNDFLKNQLCRKKYPFDIDVVNGGTSRSESIKNGVLFVNKMMKNNADSCILIHDTTHPYLDSQATEELIALIEGKYSAATLVTHVWDTVYRCEESHISETLKRENIGVGASPEAFKFSFLKKLFIDEVADINQYTSVGNYAQAKGEKIGIVWSSLTNLKITYPEDLNIFKLSSNYFLEN